MLLVSALQIRHFIFFARAFIFNARVKGAVSRGAHVNLEAHRVVDFSFSVASEPVGRYSGNVYAPQEGMSAV